MTQAHADNSNNPATAKIDTSTPHARHVLPLLDLYYWTKLAGDPTFNATTEVSDAMHGVKPGAIGLGIQLVCSSRWRCREVSCTVFENASVKISDF